MAWNDEYAESFYATLRVILHQPIVEDGLFEDGKTNCLIGYYINIGLNAKNAHEAIKNLEGMITDGKIDWADSVWTQGANIDPTLALRSVGVAAGEAWYKSGRILFPDSVPE